MGSFLSQQKARSEDYHDNYKHRTGDPDNPPLMVCFRSDALHKNVRPQEGRSPEASEGQERE